MRVSDGMRGMHSMRIMPNFIASLYGLLIHFDYSLSTGRTGAFI